MIDSNYRPSLNSLDDLRKWIRWAESKGLESLTVASEVDLSRWGNSVVIVGGRWVIRRMGADFEFFIQACRKSQTKWRYPAAEAAVAPWLIEEILAECTVPIVDKPSALTI